MIRRAPLALLLIAGCSGGTNSPRDASIASDGGELPKDASTSTRDAEPQTRTDAEVGPDAAETTPDAGIDASTDDAGAVTIPAPSAAILDEAIDAPLSSYHRNANTGDIWCTPCDGAPIILAAAAFAGELTADARLLEQMRHVLGGGNDPFLTGGYSANDERNVTAMFAIAKRTPRIWSQLGADEIEKIDLIMKGSLVADAYLTSDATNSGGELHSFMGDTNFNRDWNPNYREGMIGAMIVATEYFGGQQAAEALLAAHDHAAFTAELEAAGLDNAHWVFSTYARDPSAGAPDPATVEQGIADYRLYGLSLGQLLDIYVNLANDTFSEIVACGLNDGAGIQVGNVAAGTIVSGCDALPNLGAVGMEKEFDSVDAEGRRSSAGYVRLGLRTHLFNHLVLLIHGDWADTTESAAALDRVEVGVIDFFYKASRGYRGYSHGDDEGVFECGADLNCPLNEAIWTEIIAPAHGR